MSSRDPIIFRRQLSIRDLDGEERIMLVQAVERDKPYQIALLFVNDDEYIRVNITKEMLSEELRKWMAGDIISHPLLIASQVLIDKMHAFIQLGHPPAPSSMVVWILSRCQMRSTSNGALTVQFGGNQMGSDVNLTRRTLRRSHDELLITQSQPASPLPEESIPLRPNTAGATSTSMSRTKGLHSSSLLDTTRTFEVTEQLLGRSQALSDLKKKKLRNRSGAQISIDKREWTPDFYRLTADIRRSREAVREDMETRRRIIEVAQMRQVRRNLGSLALSITI
jgi:hypothetical protein